MMNLNNHIHYYDWIISWDFNSDGKLIFSIGKHSADQEFAHYFDDAPDVQRGIYECKRTIDRIRDDRWHLAELPAMDALKIRLRDLKYPPPPPDYESAPAFDTEDNDYIPF
jgi:hypothetical protein